MSILKIVTIEGSVGISTAESIKEKLLDALQTADQVILNCQRAVDVDLSFVQLLLSAKKSAHKQGKKLQISDNPSIELKKALISAGILTNVEIDSNNIDDSVDKPLLQGLS